MSTISTALDNLLSVVQTALPDHLHLPNGLNLSDNSTQILRKGFGVWPVAAQNTYRDVSCQLSWKRDIIVSITGVVRANEFNVAAKFLAAKQLLEYQILVLSEIEKDPTLGSSLISNATVTSDSGVLEISKDEQGTYWGVQTFVSVEYFENLL